MNKAEREHADQIIEHAKKMIWVTFRKEGIHAFPEALTNPKFSDVSFLGHPHRHIFHFKVWIEVFHDDRDIEFIQFKRWCENLYSNDVIKLDHKSCEMISDDLYLQIADQYPNRRVWIEVSEDGENGSFIKYNEHYSNSNH